MVNGDFERFYNIGMQSDNFDRSGMVMGGQCHDHGYGHAGHGVNVMMITASNNDDDDDDSFTLKSICLICTSDLARTSDVHRHSTGMVRFTKSLQMKMMILMMVVKFTKSLNTIILNDLEEGEN